MWQAINIPKHIFMDNPAGELADKLNNLNAKNFILLSEIDESIEGVAWVEA